MNTMLCKWDIVGGTNSETNRTEYAIFDGFGFLCGYKTKEEAETARREILERIEELDGLSEETRNKYLSN